MGCSVCESDALVQRKEWCQCRACNTRFLGEVILPDRAIVENGKVYVKRKDTENSRREMYETIALHPETAEELICRAKQARNSMLVNGPSFVGDIRGISSIESKRGSVLLIPNQYIPPRIWRMWKRRDIAALEAYGAAMYVYFTKNSWLLWGSAPGWRIEFVSGGGNVFRFGGSSSLRCDPQVKAVLDYGLIEEGRFADVPGVDYDLERTARHHQGKQILTNTLRRFARMSKLSN